MSIYSHYDDDALFTQVRKGDHGAFSELFNRYWEDLLDMAFQRLKSREAAEEIVQEIFVQVYIRRETIQTHKGIEAYLKTAVKYKVIDTYRRQQRQYALTGAIKQTETVSTEQPDDTLEAKQLHEKVMQVAEQLPEKCKAVFLLSRVQGLSNPEIAAQLDISIATVKTHLNKALRILRKEVGDRYMDLLIVGFIIFFR